MSGFQILALVVLALLLAATVAAALRGQIGRRVGLAWSLVWLAAAVAISWPGTTQRLAGLLGIERGADLVLYCFVVLTMIGFFMTYARLRRLNYEITQLVRHLAVTNPQKPENRPESGPEKQ